MPRLKWTGTISCAWSMDFTLVTPFSRWSLMKTVLNWMASPSAKNQVFIDLRNSILFMSMFQERRMGQTPGGAKAPDAEERRRVARSQQKLSV